MGLLRVTPYQYALGVAPFPARSAATIKPAHYPKAALSGAPPQVCFGSRLCEDAKDRNAARITFSSWLILVERACEVDGQDSHGRMTSIAIKRLGVFTQPRPNADAAD